MTENRATHQELARRNRLIRIHAREYPGIPETGTFTHFNLAPATYAVGERYILARILRAGRGKVPPILELANCRVARCVAFDPVVPYAVLDPELFRASMSHITGRLSLENAILERYLQSRPELSAEDVLAAGVSVATLEIEPEPTGPSFGL